MANDEKSSGPGGRSGPVGKGGAAGQEQAARAPRTLMLVVSMLVVLVVGAAGGLVTAKFSGPRTATAATPDANGESANPGRPGQGNAHTIPDDKYAYVELEPVIVNLDEYRLMRYARATVVLELDATNKRQLQNVTDLIERRRLVLKNRLTLFLAGRTPDEVRGDKALRHLERRILDDFNQELWPDKKGLIRDVMFKEFAVQ